MKKIVRTLCLVAMVALVATSCKKKEEVTELTLTMEEVQGFQAGPSFDGSKIYLDPNAGYAAKWNAEDKVMVYNLASDGNSTCEEFTSTAASEGQARATFYGNNIGAKKDLGYFMFFQADKATREILNNNTNTETFVVADEQTYNPAHWIDQTALVLASPAESSNGSDFNVNLQHIFGVLNIGIGENTGGYQVNNIVVTDDEVNLTGALDLKLPQVNPAEFTRLMNLLQNGDATYAAQLSNYLQTLGYHAHDNGGTAPQGRTITLNCNNIALTMGQYQYFFMPLRPGALYKGFTVTINFTNGTSTSYHFGADMNNLTKPGYFTNVYALTSGHWYINNAWVKP